MKYLTVIRHRFVRIYQSYFPAPLIEEEYEMIRSELSPGLQALFFSQPLCDQRHGLLVFEKSRQLFKKSTNPPSREELMHASFFHDVAKKDCRFSVTQRVIVATLLIFIPVKRYVGLRNSKMKFLRRIGIYADHAELSWEMLKNETTSDFVRQVTIFHHGNPSDQHPSADQRDNVELFIMADTL